MRGERSVDAINRYEGQNLLKTLEIKIVQLEANYAQATMPVTERHQQTMGYLHGGATIALAETIAGIGSYAILPAELGCVGMQISASHLSSARLGDRVIAKAVLQHRGKRTHVWDVNVYSEENGRLISTIKVTNAVITLRTEAQSQ